ncbi:ICE-like protease (caspase) p20 domain protein [Rhizoctonia solani]|uniref:ICE-like protease (Caspase) p20 domain protein n=1 Tax=Rhizoctonia solani TaxID=456999 RepID=A0A8H8T2V1_9AGAM|nr:ICE-like protease (caspase) p20 domain protein [Rhizoctonia solani]QRW26709.1 ICE-like protease (caspase) p20 domain protein [Rhizoctonia solani]
MSINPTDENNVIVTPRGIASAAVVQNDVAANRRRRLEIEKDLQDAIQCGDNISINGASTRGQGTQVERRALIIAPTYEEYKNKTLATLTSTAADARLVYKMLVEHFDYKPENIRILCNVNVPGMDGRSFPTKKIYDVSPGYYRFLHFSGHGIIQLSKNENEGKLVRRPGSNILGKDRWRPDVKPRQGDTERAPSQITAERIKEITVSLGDLAYYNEAIATGNYDGNKKLENNLIYDKVSAIVKLSNLKAHFCKLKTLNGYLSKLPEDSVMTCTLDCCASGRMLNLHTKVEGAGFRGGDDESDSDEDSDDKPPGRWSRENEAIRNSELDLIGATNSRGALDQGRAEAGSGQNSSKPVAERTELEAGFIPGARIFSRLLGAVGISSFQVTLSEELPDAEKQMDHTRPNLYDKVSLDVTQHRQAAIPKLGSGPNPQFVQLWGSLPDDSQASKDGLLDSNVIF